jgi:DNA-binding XRE family transcriptional regulator
MTPTQYRAAIAALGLTQDEAAKLFGVTLRTSNRWAMGHQKVPRAVEIALAELTPTRLRFHIARRLRDA